jgi:hypothetical protein
MRRLAVISGVLILLAGGGQALRAPSAQAKGGITFSPAADAYVSASARRRNFGGAKALRAQSSPLTRSYVRFNVAGLDAPVTFARLQLFAHTTTRGFAVRTAGSNWSERGITFANAPHPGGVVGRSGRVRRGRWISLDVTRLVKGNGSLSLAITGAAKLSSREAGSTRPQLIVGATPPTLIAAGDIADCTTAKDAETAALVAKIPGTIAGLGDLAYDSGTLAEYNACYQPTWGPFKARTRPTPGNHEYLTPGAAGYFAYWGAVAGNPAQGWYSYDLGGWHVISLNSNCPSIGGCQPGSPQETWLRADLAAHPKTCTAAYWHHPRFSGGEVGDDLTMAPLWQALYDANADLVLVGHSHTYQRFAPMDANGVLDAARGLREFVVGTGGRPFHVLAPRANQEVTNGATWGVLRLTLRNSGYDWKFLPIAGQTFTDSGSQACH